ncbi:MAG TPA: PP2C family protein-serine/threonine phosphatase [Acidimicrobiales bacterium]|nr:PP2C family protein-serine/threonine phosphatase [Acidimicrobiales bacterium]
MFTQPWLAAAAVFCAVAAMLWGRAAARLARAARRIEAETASSSTGRDATDLARAAFDKDLHTALLYSFLAVGLGVASISSSAWYQVPLLLVSIPVVITIRYAPRFFAEARLAENRAMLERRAEEVLAQEQLAPRRWADRLAPEDLPHVEGLEMGRVYEPGTGMMAGDFYDVFVTAGKRVAAVIGDVAGHGIDPSITAFQVKYLLRTFLQQFRDPGQGLEELNKVLSISGRPEDLVSVCVVILDPEAGTLRHASAGHPAIWLWQESEIHALRSTGPLLTLDPNATFFSRERSLLVGDVIVMYTDGLTEARSGGQIFGEDRIAGVIRRDPGRDTTTLCKDLLEAARDFASEPLTDDVAILSIRRI